jgi:thermitase
VRALLSAVLAALLVLGLPLQAVASSGATTAPSGGDLVVAIRKGTSSSVVATVVKLGGSVTEDRSQAGFLVVRPPIGPDSTAFERALAVDAGVRYIERESIVHAAFIPNDPEFGEQWGPRRIGMPAAWDVQRGDASVKVAVLDTGVDFANPDLVGVIDTQNDRDFVDDDSTAADANGHGTHVVGIIAAALDNWKAIAGVAPGCTILPVRVLDARGNGSSSSLALGIRWAADHGADVINCSLGGSEDSMLVYEATEYALSKDCVVVSAAGNENRRGVAYPAAYPGVIGVGSVNRSLRWSTFSQTGPEIDLAAPGEDILSLGLTSNGLVTTRVDSGTSMATPHVAGAAALLRSAYPEWSAGQVERRLEQSAEDILASGRDQQSGFGLVRPDRALGVGFVAAAETDDEVPGVPLRSGAVTGTVSVPTDSGDCFEVEFAADQGIQASVVASATGRVRLRLFGPETTTLASATPIASAVSLAGEPAAIAARADSGAGRYFLQVSAASGSAPYRLQWRRGHVTALTIVAPATVTWGKKGTLTATLVRPDNTPLAGVSVVAERRPAGAESWSTFNTAAVSDAGAFRISIEPTATTEYRVRFEGVPGELSAVSDIVTVGIKASITAPSAGTGTLRVGKQVALSGTVRPAGGSVRVHVWRRSGSDWIEVGNLATTLTRSAGASRYRVKTRFVKAGKYRLIAIAAATGARVETASKARIVEVQ